MNASDIAVPARYYARIGTLLQHEGIALSEVLDPLGLSLQALSEPDATMRLSEVDRLINAVAARTGRSDLAFDLGQALSASSHSFVGFGMLNCQTLDQALRFEAQYFRLIMPSFRMRYRASSDSGEIWITPTVAMSRLCLSFHLEAIGMAALRELSDLTAGARPPCRLRHSIAAPAHAHRYESLRDVSVQFAAASQPSVSVVIHSDPRALPLAMADANARQLAEERCRALVQRVTGSRAFGSWVAMMLREVSDALPTVAELAAALNISPRTLNRHLEREGTSYRALAGRIQHELACERLSTGAMGVTEVAYSLGFADPSNFARAFRAREGCSPRAYQQQQRTPKP